MDEILHHLGWLKPYKQLDNHHPWWCRILSINSNSQHAICNHLQPFANHNLLISHSAHLLWSTNIWNPETPKLEKTKKDKKQKNNKTNSSFQNYSGLWTSFFVRQECQHQKNISQVGNGFFFLKIPNLPKLCADFMVLPLYQKKRVVSYDINFDHLSPEVKHLVEMECVRGTQRTHRVGWCVFSWGSVGVSRGQSWSVGWGLMVQRWGIQMTLEVPSYR